MRRIWLLLGLCACLEKPRPVVYPEYRAEVSAESWCRLDTGVFAFVPHPQLAPPLLGYGCRAAHRDPPPVMERDASTFAELVVEPGGSIEIPVQLPKPLQGAGCRIDSVLIPHGKRVSDVAIEIANAGRMVPIVSYEQLPPPPEADGSARTVVSDGSSKRKAIWASDVPPGSLAVIADPELWPTGAVLRFDGGRTADGAASIVFEIEKEPDPPPAEEPASSTETPAGAPAAEAQPSPAPAEAPPSTGDAPAEPAPAEEGSSAAPTPPLPPQPAALNLIVYRHQIDLAAPDSFSIVLRARQRPFGIGVRSDRESADPRLSFRAPGAAEPTPTHLVPQVGIVVSRCGRPVEEVLRDIR